MASKLYYEFGKPTTFSTFKQLQTAVGQKSKISKKKKKQKPSDIRAWLESLDA
jgi:hypothetical protein